MPALQLDPPLLDAHQQALTVVPTLAITTAQDYHLVAEWLVKVKMLRKTIDAELRPGIDAALKAHRETVRYWKTKDAPLELAEANLKLLIAAWDESERHRLEVVNRQRLLDAARAAEDRQLAEAEALDTLGEHDLAQEVLNEPLVPLVAPHEEPVKAEGVSSRTIWRYRIVDLALVPRSYLMPDDKRIGQVVRAMGASTNIPGIQPYAERIVSARTVAA